MVSCSCFPDETVKNDAKTISCNLCTKMFQPERSRSRIVAACTLITQSHAQNRHHSGPHSSSYCTKKRKKKKM